MDGWNTSFLLGWHIFRGELLVSGRVVGLVNILVDSSMQRFNTELCFQYLQVWGDVLAAVLKRIVGRKSAQDALSQTLGHFDCISIFKYFLPLFLLVHFQFVKPNSQMSHFLHGMVPTCRDH